MKISHSTSFTCGILACGAGLLVWNTFLKPEHAPPPPSAGSSAVSAKPPSGPLSPRVAAVLSPELISLTDRKTYLDTLGYQLGQADRIALLDSITNTPPNGLTNEDWFAFANAILDVLREQRPAMPEFSDRLVSLWHDPKLDPTLRDYTLQVLREWVMDQHSRSVHEERPEKLSLIRDTFLAAATPGNPTCDPKSTTTGTALLALHEWTGEAAPAPVRIDPAVLEPILLAYAADPSAHRGVRATALQLCARRKMTAILPLARDCARDASSDLILRLAAISCLHDLGTPDDHLMLADLSRKSEADPLIRSALASALRAGTTPKAIPNP